MRRSGGLPRTWRITKSGNFQTSARISPENGNLPTQNSMVSPAIWHNSQPGTIPLPERCDRHGGQCEYAPFSGTTTNMENYKNWELPERQQGSPQESGSLPTQNSMVSPATWNSSRHMTTAPEVRPPQVASGVMRRSRRLL